MNSPLLSQWAGFQFTSIELENANPLTAGLSGQPIALRGTDHPDYGRAVMDAWRTAAGMPTDAPAGSARLAGDYVQTGPVDERKWYERLAHNTGILALGIVLIGLGAWAVVKQ